MADSTQKPDIVFPTRWGYKVIGTDNDAVAEAIRECVALCLGAKQGERAAKVAPSKTSAGGKYVSWSLNLRIESLQERDELFAALSGHADVRMVI